MKKRFLFILILFMPFIINAEETKIEWQKILDDDTSIQVSSLELDSDSCIISVGNIKNSDNNSLDAVIVKSSDNGEVIWKKSFGGSAYDTFYDVTVLDDNFYIAVGYSNSTDIDGLPISGENDGIIVKFDKEGNIIWKKTFGGSDYDYIMSVDNIDNNIIFVGEFRSVDIDGLTNNGDSDAFMVKMDQNGNIIWQKSWGGSDSDYFMSVKVSISGDVFAGGGFSSDDLEEITHNGTGDSIIIKYNDNGEIIWQKSFGGNSSDSLFALDVNDNGDVYATGYSYSTKLRGTVNRNDCYGFVLKYDKDGNFIYERTLGAGYGTTFRDISIDYDGNVIVVGGANGLEYDGITSLGNTDSYIVKYDSSGEMIFIKNWGGLNNETFTVVKAKEDGSIFVAGNTSSSEIDGFSEIDGKVPVLLKYFTEYELENIETDNGTSTVVQNGKYGIVTPTPKEGFKVARVLVRDTEGNEIAVTALADGTYSFDLYSDVTVEVIYEEDIVNPKTGVPSGIVFLPAILFMGLCIYFIKKCEKSYEI